MLLIRRPQLEALMTLMILSVVREQMIGVMAQDNTAEGLDLVFAEQATGVMAQDNPREELGLVFAVLDSYAEISRDKSLMMDELWSTLSNSSELLNQMERNLTVLSDTVIRDNAELSLLKQIAETTFHNLTALQTIVAEQQESNANSSYELILLSDEISSQKGETALDPRTVSELVTEVMRQKQVITNLTVEVEEEMDMKLKDVYSKVIDNAQHIRLIQQNISELSGAVGNNSAELLVVNSEEPYTFPSVTAYATSTLIYKEGQDVVFSEQLLANPFYSTGTGVFVCSESGAYLVAIDLVKPRGQYINIEVLREDHVLMQSRSNSFSGVVLMECQRGEKIFMSSHGYGSVTKNSHISIVKLQDKALGFSAVMKNDQQYQPGDVLQYQRTEYNMGGAFSLQTNKFQCSVSGVYYVAVSLQLLHPWGMGAAVVRTAGTKEKPWLHLEAASHTSGQISNSGLVECEEGDVLYINTTQYGAVNGREQPQTIFSVYHVQIQSARGLMNNLLVGFSVYKLIQQKYKAADVITFESVIYNTNHYYDTATHQFHAPVSGIYLVSLNVRKLGELPMALSVESSYERVIELLEPDDVFPDQVISKTTVFQANAGTVVQVKAISEGAVAGHSDAHTTFSCFLIYKL